MLNAGAIRGGQTIGHDRAGQDPIDVTRIDTGILQSPTGRDGIALHGWLVGRRNSSLGGALERIVRVRSGVAREEIFVGTTNGALVHVGEVAPRTLELF